MACWWINALTNTIDFHAHSASSVSKTIELSLSTSYKITFDGNFVEIQKCFYV